jgi:hypothetical protein
MPFSNLYSSSGNPAYTPETFLVLYPQFSTIPEAFLTMYVNLAHASLQEPRWKESWQLAMGLFIAHFCTLYLQTMASSTSPAAQVLAKGQAAGLTTSKSVGDVSKSVDYNLVAQGLEGWAGWLLTGFGQQLATLGKFVGKGNMYVW